MLVSVYSAVGHNKLSKTVKQLTDKLEIQGYFTNHSLHRTCATRLYQGGVDDQRIMAVTGHRSTNGVKVYKEISHQQHEEITKIIQGHKGKRKMDVMDDEKESCQKEKKQK